MTSIGKRLALAIGPATDLPSWSWIGPDTARELSKYFDVQIFRSDLIPPCDVALVVKKRPSNVALADAVRRGIRLVYCPVDRYESEAEVRADAAFLGRCRAVLIHCERLRPLVTPLAPHVWGIDHHDRFGLATPAAWKEHGFVLWVGGFQHAPHLLRWLDEHPPDHPLTLLTDWQNPRGRAGFEVGARALGIRADLADGRLNGHSLVEWSAENQARLLSAAKAAIDVKGGQEDFNQFTKPPTKAQKYVISGLPCAINRDSYSSEYFAARGFTLATPADEERWFSRDYFGATLAEGRRLRDEISLAAVGLKLKEYIARIS